MPLVPTSLRQSVNPEGAESLGPLLYGFAKRTKAGLFDASDNQVSALLDTFTKMSADQFAAVGGEECRKWAKAHEVPYEINVLGLPYYGPKAGKDEDAEWFSPQTDFLDVHDNPNLPIFYVHGAENNKEVVSHAKVKSTHYDHQGKWFKIELYRDSPRYEQFRSAHEEGKLRASSGVVPGSKQKDEATGHIKTWLVGELSLVDLRDGYRPSNGYAITKAGLADTFLMEDYYGENVDSEKPTLLEALIKKFNDLREEISRLLPHFALNKAVEEDKLVEEDPMGKCEECDVQAAEEAERLREYIATKAAAGPAECLPCRAAVSWIGSTLKAGKMTGEEALEALTKYERSADGFDVFQAAIEARLTPGEKVYAKAQAAGQELYVLPGNSATTLEQRQQTVDPAAMARMREGAGLPRIK